MVGHQWQHASQGLYYQSILTPQYMLQHPFLLTLRVVTKEVKMIAKDAAAEATNLVQSSSNLLNDTQSSLLVSPLPGLKQKTHSRLSSIVYPVRWREASECITASEEGKDSLFTVPVGQDKFQSVSRIHFIPDQCFQISSQEKLEVLPVGSRLQHFLP